MSKPDSRVHIKNKLNMSTTKVKDSLVKMGAVYNQKPIDSRNVRAYFGVRFVKKTDELENTNPKIPVLTLNQSFPPKMPVIVPTIIFKLSISE